MNTPDTECGHHQIMLKGGVLKLDSDGKCPDCGEQVMKNTPDTEVQIEQIVEKVRTVEFLHGVPVELPNRTKELLRSGIREALSSRDTYWKERVDRAFVILDTNIQELVTYEERRVSKESVLTCVRRIKRELDNLK